MQNRTGQNLSGNASQCVQGIHQGGVSNTDLQNRAQNVNRDNALRGQASREAFGSGSGGQQRAGNESHAGRAGGFGANGAGQQRTAGAGGNTGAGAGLGVGGGMQRVGARGERYFGRAR